VHLQSEVQGQKILVKMLPTHYGENVHLALASAGYAPAFYGTFQRSTYPVLYVMEYLSDDWVTLNEFKARTRDSGAFQPFLAEIRTFLNQIVDVLEAKRFVHGDLRMTNIMIQVEEDGRRLKPKGGLVKLKVIDFDWAGECGTVEYPANRNTVDIEWPKPEGGGDDMLIGKNDDRKMVELLCKLYLITGIVQSLIISRLTTYESPTIVNFELNETLPLLA
jgi:hypothetical protein